MHRIWHYNKFSYIYGKLNKPHALKQSMRERERDRRRERKTLPAPFAAFVNVDFASWLVIDLSQVAAITIQ